MQELTDLLEGLRASISDMQVMLVLCLDRPFPNLNKIMHLVLQYAGFVRFVVVSLDRSPRAILQRMMQTPVLPTVDANSSTRGSVATDDGAPSTTASSAAAVSSHAAITPVVPNEAETVDPFALLQHLETCTQGKIKVTDFVPARVGQALEPLLKYLGYGHFSVRPSPFCGFVTCLVNTDSLRAFPVARLVDLHCLHREMSPILARIRREGGAIGISTANAIRKELSRQHWFFWFAFRIRCSEIMMFCVLLLLLFCLCRR